MWYTFFGAAATIITALMHSGITGFRVDAKDVNLKLIAPIIRKYYASESQNQNNAGAGKEPQTADESAL